MPRKTWTGQAVTKATAYVIQRDSGICWLCHHPRATSLDHVQPASIRPDLEWTETNWRAAHLNPAGHHHNGCTIDGCQCPGNTGRGNRTPTIPSSRRW